MNNPILLIVVAQMFGTSLWFSTNGVLKQIEQIWSLSASDLGLLTNSVQFGFILGTLLFSVTGFADKFKPSRIVMLCCFLGATSNILIIFEEISFTFVIFSISCWSGFSRNLSNWNETYYYLGPSKGAQYVRTSSRHVSTRFVFTLSYKSFRCFV